MTYTVTITSPDGKSETYPCGGATDAEALIYAGKVVEANSAGRDPDASVSIRKDGKDIGPAATVAEMTKRAVGISLASVALTGRSLSTAELTRRERFAKAGFRAHAGQLRHAE